MLLARKSPISRCIETIAQHILTFRARLERCSQKTPKPQTRGKVRAIAISRIAATGTRLKAQIFTTCRMGGDYARRVKGGETLIPDRRAKRRSEKLRQPSIE